MTFMMFLQVRRRRAEGESAASEGAQGRPMTARRRRPVVRARRAGLAIAIVTLAVTLLAAVVARLADPSDFESYAEAVWWAVQTVTSVGYGDVVPERTVGRVVGVLVMLAGIGFVTVVTAAITATFLDTAREARADDPAPQSQSSDDALKA